MTDNRNLKILQKLKNDNLGVKLLVGLVFWVCLALFLHFRQVKGDVLELNSKAPNYIVAQVDFEFPDDEATIIMKQKSISNIHSIFFINAKEIKQKVLDLEKYLIENQKWKALPSVSYEIINDAVEKFENILIKSKFTDAKTLKTMKRFQVNVSDYLVLNFTDKENRVLANGCFSILAKKLAIQLENVPEETINFVINYFEDNKYFLREDYLTLSQVKRHIEKRVSQQYTHVKAGELIIGYKEKVTLRHLAMLEAMKAPLAEKINLFQPLTILGNVLISFVFILLSILYFKIEQPNLLKSFKQLSLIITILLLTLLFAKITEYIILKRTTVLENTRYAIIVPFAALLFSILFNIRLSLFFSTLLSIILSVTLAIDHSAFLITNIVTSLIVIVTTRSLRKRTEVFIVCGKCMVGAVPIILSLFFINNRTFNVSLFTNMIGSFIALLIIGIIVVGLLPVLETVFDVLTDITLMEYLDPNNELLRRLTLEVPGSYQHSLVLGNLAEAAAQKIKANALFCKVAALYHDIGKLINPNYFIENQNEGINIHQLLTPLESAHVIISHVLDGEMLGKKYRLPRKIIDIIKQHHGTTLVYYFFRKELELRKENSLKIDQNLFRYPGPKPKSKEAAIIMIADSMEAASRSLEIISEKVLNDLVDKIVKEKAEDNQFDECCLTFEELKNVKISIVKTLMLTRHVRIKYPEKKENKLGLYLEPYYVDKSI
jgi:putative nucleotidyltransferase with HDIG domain